MQREEWHPPDWTNQLEPAQKQLLELAFTLYQTELAKQDQPGAPILPDYSFVVFPLAKAYEGWLKTFLLRTSLIDQNAYSSRRFRIGRVLNPDVPHQQRDEWWLYDDVARSCGDKVARQIWQTWLLCRNHLFHYFPTQTQTISLSQAHHCLSMLLETMEMTISCVIIH